MKPSPRGFTLLELLISLSLLVVILVIVTGALSQGSRSVAAGERRVEEQERFRAVLSILDSQVQSQLPLTFDGERGRRYYFRGDGKSLRLATARSIRTGQAGYVVVEYRIESGAAGGETLLARETTPGVEGGADTLLLRGEGMRFDYFHRDPAEEEGRWVEALEDGTALPRAVRFRAALGRGVFEEVFPVRVRGMLQPAAGVRP